MLLSLATYEFFHELSAAALQVISGEVSTNILKNDAHRTLPEGLSRCKALHL